MRRMRMLLTAAGIRNDALVEAFADLVGKPFAECRVVVVVTASLVEAGDKGWLLDDLVRLRGLGWRELDIVDLNTVPRSRLVERLENADVVYGHGGNQFHLARSVVDRGLVPVFRELLETRVYVGVSAGSMIFSRHFDERAAEAMDDLADLRALGAPRIAPPFGLFDWFVKPHLNSPSFPERDDRWADAVAERVAFPVYLLDDDSAVRVRDGDVDVVTEGRWRLLG